MEILTSPWGREDLKRAGNPGEVKKILATQDQRTGCGFMLSCSLVRNMMSCNFAHDLGKENINNFFSMRDLNTCKS